MLLTGPNGKPILHTLVYGPTGSGKTSFLTTFPTPQLILAFDPYDKFLPYLKRGWAQEYHDDYYDQMGIDVVHVTDPDGNLIAQIEYYADPDPDKPTAYQKFQQRIPYLTTSAGDWATVAVDSLTFYQNAYLRYAEKVLNPSYRDPRLWYGDLKREMVNQFLARFAWLKTNVVVIAHDSEDKDEFAGGTLRGIAAVGKLMKEMPSGYGELYRAAVRKDTKNGELRFCLQTKSDNLWSAASQIDAPNWCDMTYDALWENMAPKAA